MKEVRLGRSPQVRPFAREFIRFWPDGEDLLWAKSVWPALEEAGLFSDASDEGERWTRSRLLALAVHYAESARHFGTLNYQRQTYLNRTWLLVAFGSPNNLDDALHDVWMALNDFYSIDGGPSGEFFVPLVRSLLTGNGTPAGDPELLQDLDRIAEHGLGTLSLHGDNLYGLWVGGNAEFSTLMCLP